MITWTLAFATASSSSVTCPEILILSPTYASCGEAFIVMYVALGVIITLISDIFFWEFVWEGIIAFLYSLKECGRFIVMLGEFFNRMRNMKQLV